MPKSTLAKFSVYEVGLAMQPTKNGKWERNFIAYHVVVGDDEHAATAAAKAVEAARVDFPKAFAFCMASIKPIVTDVIG